MLPSDPKARKRIPLATGLLDYFPDALADVAGLSLVANEQHNPGEPLHWSRHKSNDHDDCLMRHFMERGTVDSDGIRHRAKVAWRALAALQLEIEAAQDMGRGDVVVQPIRPGVDVPAYDAHPFNPVAAEEGDVVHLHGMDGTTRNFRIASPNWTTEFCETLKGVIPGSARLDGQPLNLPSHADGS